MFAAFLLLASIQLSPAWLEAYDRITPQVAAERVARCGAGAVTVRSDAELDADVLVVAGTTLFSDRQLACIDEAASFYDVELAPAAQPRLDAIRQARSSALMTAEARKWLVAHKLLDRLPKYESGATDDAAFARQIEQLCHADRALASRYGPHALSPEWAARQKTGNGLEDGPLACLLNVTLATGFKMNFIGNEQVAP